VSNAKTIKDHSGLDQELSGRLLALDLGAKRVGVAVSDELLISVRPLSPLSGSNWKELLLSVGALVRSFDAKALVIGLPLNLDGSYGRAAREVQTRAEHFQKSLGMPVYLQDERLTTREAEASLREAGTSEQDIRDAVDSQAAVIILHDFIAALQSR
jgi:putative holliday junction resolvase